MKALFHTLVETLRWDETIERWRAGTNRGDDIRACSVVHACGVLNTAKLPGIAGIDAFRDKLSRTARWDYGYTRGERRNSTLQTTLSNQDGALLANGSAEVELPPR